MAGRCACHAQPASACAPALTASPPPRSPSPAPAEIVSKGRCKCATGYKFDAARNCVLEVPVPPTRKMKL